MALLLRPRLVTWSQYEGTLARAPLAGGTPREVLEGVLDADWSPDGKELAVIHVVGDRYRLEYPLGRVLYEPPPPTWLSSLRVSRRGDQVGFSEHPVGGDKRGGVSIVDLQGQRRSLASGYAAVDNPRWSPSGDEIWFSATRASGTPQQIHAVSLTGRERVIAEVAGGLEMLAVSARGRALASRVTTWTEVRARGRGALKKPICRRPTCPCPPISPTTEP